MIPVKYCFPWLPRGRERILKLKMERAVAMKKTWMSRAVAVLAVLAMQFSWGGGLLPQADGGADANRLSPIGPNPFGYKRI